MNKLFKKEMPILVEGLKFVHKNRKKRFNMDYWTSNDSCSPKKDVRCRTSGCAMGWKDAFIKDSPIKCHIINIKGSPYYYHQLEIKYKNLSDFEAISAAYGITRRHARYLFSPYDYDDDNVTALMVAHRIETVLYDGFPKELS